MTDKFYLFKSAKEAEQFMKDHIEPVSGPVDPERISSPSRAAIQAVKDIKDFNNAEQTVRKRIRAFTDFIGLTSPP